MAAPTPFNLIPWSSVESDPRWQEADRDTRAGYVSNWEQANIARAGEAGAGPEVLEKLKLHSAFMRLELYPDAPINAANAAKQALEVMRAPGQLDWSEVNEDLDLERFRESEGMRARAKLSKNPEEAAEFLRKAVEIRSGISRFTKIGKDVLNKAELGLAETPPPAGSDTSETYDAFPTLQGFLGPALSAQLKPIIQGSVRSTGSTVGSTLGAAAFASGGWPIALVAAIMGGMTGGQAQEAALQAMETPEETQARQARWEEDRAAHPVASRIGEAASAAPFFKPSVSEIAKAFRGDKAAQLNVATAMGIGAGTEPAIAMVEGRPVDFADMMANAVGEVIFNKPTAMGRKLGFQSSENAAAPETPPAAAEPPAAAVTPPPAAPVAPSASDAPLVSVAPTPREALESKITTLETELAAELDAFGESETAERMRADLTASIDELGALNDQTPLPATIPNELPESQQVPAAVEPAAVEASQPAGAVEAATPAAAPAEVGATVEGSSGAVAEPELASIVPAIKVGDTVLRGQPGDTHKAILDRHLAENPDDVDALVNFDSKSNPNFFVDATGNEISRAQLKEKFGVESSQELKVLQEKAAPAAPPEAPAPPETQFKKGELIRNKNGKLYRVELPHVWKGEAPDTTKLSAFEFRDGKTFGPLRDMRVDGFTAEPAAKAPETPAATPTPTKAVEPEGEVITKGEAQLAQRVDAERSRLERLADFRGSDIPGFDAESAAQEAIIDVINSIKPEATDAEIAAATTNRLGQIVEDMRRKELAQKRGGGEQAKIGEEALEGSGAVPAPSSKPDKQASKRELADAIAEEAAKMDAKDRTILYGMQEQQSLAEIARGLGISPAAAQKRWKGIQERLQSKLARFTEGAVMSPLGGRFQQRKGPGITLTSILTEPYSAGKMRRKVATLWLGKYGALPPEMRDAIQQSGHDEQAMRSQFSMLANDLRAAVDEHAGDDAALRESTMATVSDYMEGDAAGIAAMRAMPQRLQETAQRARMALDTVSEALVKEGAVPVGLGNTIIGNIGSWMRRYYAAFDPQANWNLDALRTRAAGTGPEALKAKKILDDAERHIYIELTRQSKPNNPEAIEGVMRSLTDRQEMESYLFGSGKVNPDVSSFLARQKLAPEVRALMGEEKNPILRTERSGEFLSQAVTRNRMQQTLRHIGLGTGIFSLRQRGRYSVSVPAPNPGRAPFRGLWTTPEFAAAMGDARLYGDDLTTATGWFEKLWTRFVGETKFNLVAANPRSTVVNAMGGMFGAMMNGSLVPIPGLGVGGLRGMSKAARDAFNTVFRGEGVIDPTAADAAFKERTRHIYTELQGQGLLDSSVTVRDFEQTVSEGLKLADLDLPKQIADRTVGAVRGAVTGYGSALAATGSRTAGVAGAAVGGAAGAVAGSQRITEAQRSIGRNVIGKPDAFWKAMVFLDNYAHQVRAGKGLREAADIAGERTRNTMPTYSKIPEGLRRVASKIPGANIFFQFQWEVYRNAYHNLRYAMKDIASPNPTDKAHGIKRLIGVAMLAGVAGGVADWMRRKHGWTKEKDEAYRRSFLPEWDKNGVIVPTKVEGSKVSYINGKYMIPQMVFMELAQSAAEGEDPAHAVGKVMGSMLDDFVRSNAAVGPVMEAATNKRIDTTGKPLTTETGWRGALDRFDYFVKKTMTPGLAQEAGKMRMAATGEQAGYGRTYSMAERLQGLLGMRVNTYDAKTQLGFRLSDMDRQWNEISKRENVETKRLAAMKTAAPETYAERVKQLKEDADRQRAELQLAAVRLFGDAYEVGMTPGEVAKAMGDKKTKLPIELRLAYIARKLREQGKKDPLTVEELRAMRKGQAASSDGDGN